MNIENVNQYCTVDATARQELAVRAEGNGCERLKYEVLRSNKSLEETERPHRTTGAARADANVSDFAMLTHDAVPPFLDHWNVH